MSLIGARLIEPRFITEGLVSTGATGINPARQRFFRFNEGTSDFIVIPSVSVDRIVMAVWSDVGGAGLPSGAPDIVLNELQVIDFQYTGVLTDIGKNGVDLFNGIIADVFLYYGGVLVRSYSIDDNNNTVKDSISGFDGTVINGNVSDWKLYAQDGRDWVRDAVLYPNAVNEVPNPHNPESWPHVNEPDGQTVNVGIANSSGTPYLGLAESLTGSYYTFLFESDLSAVAGEAVYTSLLVRGVTLDTGFRVQLNVDNVNEVNVYINPFSGAFSISGGNCTGRATQLSYGDWLIEIKYVAQVNTSNIDMYVNMWNVDVNGAPHGLPAIGDQLYVQAAFFGISSDWPAVTEDRLTTI